jgi:hypothetical protein
MGGGARIVCGFIGGALVFGAVVTVFAVRPFNYAIASLAAGATVPGMVLIAAGIWGRPPQDLM